MANEGNKTETVTIGILDEKLSDFLGQMTKAYHHTEENLRMFFGEKIKVLEEEVADLKERNLVLDLKVEQLEKKPKT